MRIEMVAMNNTEQGATDVPAAGTHYDVPADLYHRWPLPSNSVLGHLARSPLHCRHAIDHPQTPTPDMAFGTAFHARVLEPATFRDRFAVASCEASTGKGEACNSPARVRNGNRWLCGRHGKVTAADAGSPTLLSEDDDAALAAMHDAVESHGWAGPTLALAGITEASVVFDDPATGVRCKMRADRVVTDRRRQCVVDLKTTVDASPDALARTIHQRGYHRQAAMYLRGLAAVGIEAEAFVIVAVEKAAPYAINVVQVDDDAIAAGNAELDRLLALWAECEASGLWPGYGDGSAGLIGLPAWAKRREEIASEV